MKHAQTMLLTGIPRSGTTLCCKLLNQIENTIALHEPIDPQKLAQQDDVHGVVQDIQQKIEQLRQALLDGEQFEHGDRSHLSLDNPISNQAGETGLRGLSAKRGLIQAPKQRHDVRLIVKQNALFTALSMPLSQQFKLVAIVREPISVLLSWMTVDLPVNKGRLPAGERFDKALAQALQNGTVLHRQMRIYQWFIAQFQASNISVIRYEDVVSSSGAALYHALSIADAKLVPLTVPERSYPVAAVNALKEHESELVERLVSPWYSAEDITLALSHATRLAVDGTQPL